MQCAFSLLDLTLYHTLPPPWVHQNRTYPANMWLQFSNAVQGVDFPYVSKIHTRSFWRQSFSCTNHFFSRYYRKLQCVDISVCCSCGRRESGNNQRPALLRGPLKSSFHWYCYLMEIFDWNEIVNVRVLVALPIPLSGEFEAQPRAIGTNTVFSLTCTHTHTYIHTYTNIQTHIYTYMHTHANTVIKRSHPKYCVYSPKHKIHWYNYPKKNT